MTLADFHGKYVCLCNESLDVVYRDNDNQVTGVLHKDPLRGKISIEIFAAAMRSDLATAERRAYAVLAMCEWMRKVQKGEVK